jgi:hypothetical protein
MDCGGHGPSDVSCRKKRRDKKKVVAGNTVVCPFLMPSPCGRRRRRRIFSYSTIL